MTLEEEFQNELIKFKSQILTQLTFSTKPFEELRSVSIVMYQASTMILLRTLIKDDDISNAKRRPIQLMLLRHFEEIQDELKTIIKTKD